MEKKIKVPIYWIEIKQPGRLQFVVCPKTFTLDEKEILSAFDMTKENFQERGERYRICNSTIEINLEEILKKVEE